MTPQELAELPVGTRVRFLVDDDPEQYDYGTILVSGMLPHIKWDPSEVWESGVTSLIDLNRPAWERFVENIVLDSLKGVMYNDGHGGNTNEPLDNTD